MAVKVIHPFVKAQIEGDLRLLRFAAGVVERIPLMHLEWFALPEAVEEFAIIMEDQLDMRKEAASLDKFRRQVRVRELRSHEPVVSQLNPIQSTSSTLLPLTSQCLFTTSQLRIF